jgi:hypothetical protein
VVAVSLRGNRHRFVERALRGRCSRGAQFRCGQCLVPAANADFLVSAALQARIACMSTIPATHHAARFIPADITVQNLFQE